MPLTPHPSRASEVFNQDFDDDDLFEWWEHAVRLGGALRLGESVHIRGAFMTHLACRLGAEELPKHVGSVRHRLHRFVLAHFNAFKYTCEVGLHQILDMYITHGHLRELPNVDTLVYMDKNEILLKVAMPAMFSDMNKAFGVTA